MPRPWSPEAERGQGGRPGAGPQGSAEQGEESAGGHTPQAQRCLHRYKAWVKLSELRFCPLKNENFTAILKGC